MTRVIKVFEDASIESIDIIFDKDLNQLRCLLNNEPYTIVGQYEDEVPVIVLATTTSKVKNTYQLYPPLQDEIVYGPMVFLKMDSGREYDLDINEFLNLKRDGK
jgi:hypothetical protein